MNFSKVLLVPLIQFNAPDESVNHFILCEISVGINEITEFTSLAESNVPNNSKRGIVFRPLLGASLDLAQMKDE